MAISDSIRKRVRAEADYRCEYCKTSSRLIGMPLVIDHVLPQSLGGDDARRNLAAACYRCNEFKGSKTHASDPVTGLLVSLFNPRCQNWGEHFEWVNGGTHIAGVTSTGRGTVIALRLNNDWLVQSRALWMESGWHPPI
ncbi:MAG: HNH endonuclease [Cyanobacteria bacterium J06635_15]